MSLGGQLVSVVFSRRRAPVLNSLHVHRAYDVALHFTASFGHGAPLPISVPHRNHSEGASRKTHSRSEKLRQASDDRLTLPLLHMAV